MGYIDTHSDNTLYEVLERDINPVDDDFRYDYHGFHINPQGDGRYGVQYDGHVGTVMDFHRDDYNDVLELVADLNQLVIRLGEFDYQDNREGLIEWAGRIMTDDKQKAEENPDEYIYIDYPA